MRDHKKKKIIMNKLTAEQEKLFYHYVIENYINDKYITSDFFKNDDIKLVFKKIREYITQYKNIPSHDVLLAIIQEEKNDFKETLLKLIINKDKYKSEMNKSEKFYINIFEQYILKIKSDIKLFKDIEESRNGKIVFIEPEKEEKIDPLNITPMFKDEMYEKLPKLMKETTSNFSGRVRDMFITNQLSVLSSLFPSVYGVYSDREVYSNLFSFVSTTQSGGKGHLISNRHLIEKIEKDFEEFNNMEGNNNKRFIIPADSSRAELINLLQKNASIGLIHDTEADTITSNQGQEWGDYSWVCRKAFQHEPIEVARVDKFLRIEEPKISIGITGTPVQVINFIKNPEDGLISRFLYYVYTEKSLWKSPKPTMEKSLNNKFKGEYSDELLSIYNFYKNKNVEFELTDEQWEKFNEFFKENLYRKQNNDSDNNLIFRQGLICFRIMMILTILRTYDNEYTIFNSEYSKDNIVSDIKDFNIAIDMMEVFMVHSDIIYENIEKIAPIKQFIKSEKDKLYIELEKNFSRADVLVIAEKLNISITTVDRLLKIWKENKRIEKNGRMFIKIKE